MPSLNTRHAAFQREIDHYFAKLDEYKRKRVTKETSIRFQTIDRLLDEAAAQFGNVRYEPHKSSTGKPWFGAKGQTTIIPDGTILIDDIPCGYFEAKDAGDDLMTEVRDKFQSGYPQTNILFWQPKRAILWQDGSQAFDLDISTPDNLIAVLEAFFAYEPAHYREWRRAIEIFDRDLPMLAKDLAARVQHEATTNKRFQAAFHDFHRLACEAIRPDLSLEVSYDMIVQHVFIERIFRTVFRNPDFVRKNVIARAIETVIDALTSKSFSRDSFLQGLEPFYNAVEQIAGSIFDFTLKQYFLNNVYERFFKAFNPRIADTHGIVYTPREVVNFMVKSVEEILQRDFSRSLADEGVHTLDPFVGTGTFMLATLRHIHSLRPNALPHKYTHELHANEITLMAYYIAAMNIEHEYYDSTGEYAPFDGICFVDTFSIADKTDEARTIGFHAITEENTERIRRQQQAPIMVIIGNPPYNAGQISENDNNKNRKYPFLDRRVRDTYTKASKATNKNDLNDVYIKALRYATDRILNNGTRLADAEGIVAFITNNNFLDAISFDGVRKFLAEEFNRLYIVNLRGNVRKNPKIAGTTHNVFGIQVGVSINILVKLSNSTEHRIFYADTDEYALKEERLALLTQAEHILNDNGFAWRELTPDARHTWLTDGLESSFDAFLPMGTKEAKAGAGNAIFDRYCLGLTTNRDVWTYNFDREALETNMRRTIATYNDHAQRWQAPQGSNDAVNEALDKFCNHDDTKISWSRDLKQDVRKKNFAEFHENKIRTALYRPFCKQSVFFDKIMNEEVRRWENFMPNIQAEQENRVIFVPNKGGRLPFWCFISNNIVDLALTSLDASQCFPLYTYDVETGERQENITDWGLEEVRSRYGAAGASITKADIFHYIYAVLHSPDYRTKYAANLRRDLPRIPFVASLEVFRAYVQSGERLAELHVNYETIPEHPSVEWRGAEDMLSKKHSLEERQALFALSHEKMKLRGTKPDKNGVLPETLTLDYNPHLTLHGIPREVLEYKLGTRSALEWVVERYCVSEDAVKEQADGSRRGSGIVNDPNRSEAMLQEPEYVARLVGRVVAVSLETIAIVRGLALLTDEANESV
ncbi:MAG: DNA helicase [Candidatus Kapaibacterium sp.]|nr:MAG: DNA helicase [Candidatus Kapabacteria bacterium]